jgi:hypothetical protein
MRLFILFIISFLVTVGAQPAHAELREYGKAGFWYIYSDVHDCTMTGNFGTAGDLALDFDSRKNQVTIRFDVPQTSSLKSGDIRDIKIAFSSGTSASVDLGWGTKPFIAANNNGHVFFVRTLDEEFLTDMGKYTRLGFFYKDTILSAYNLEGSGKAVAMLRECALVRGNANPSDPFAGEKTQALGPSNT